MVIGDPYKFSIIFDRVDKWNMSINDNNGYLNLSIDSEIFPKKLINTIVNTLSLIHISEPTRPY